MPTILLVDNSRFYLELEQGFLRQTAAEVLTARNGLDALELIRVQPPDLMYMEQDLPKMDGIACCRQIKSDPVLKRIPLVMIHEPGRTEVRRLCRDAGCDAVMEKPLERRPFLAVGKKFLDLVERRQKRVSCRQLVVVRQGDCCYCGTSVDLGEGGMYVELDRPMRTQEPVALSFVMPGTKTDPIEVVSRVAWLNHGCRRPKPALPQGFGVEFTRIAGDGAGRIRKFVEARWANRMKRTG